MLARSAHHYDDYPEDGEMTTLLRAPHRLESMINRTSRPITGRARDIRGCSRCAGLASMIRSCAVLSSPPASALCAQRSLSILEPSEFRDSGRPCASAQRVIVCCEQRRR
jgi:hypothetical protein